MDDQTTQARVDAAESLLTWADGVFTLTHTSNDLQHRAYEAEYTARELLASVGVSA